MSPITMDQLFAHLAFDDPDCPTAKEVAALRASCSDVKDVWEKSRPTVPLILILNGGNTNPTEKAEAFCHVMWALAYTLRELSPGPEVCEVFARAEAVFHLDEDPEDVLKELEETMDAFNVSFDKGVFPGQGMPSQKWTDVTLYMVLFSGLVWGEPGLDASRYVDWALSVLDAVFSHIVDRPDADEIDTRLANHVRERVRFEDAYKE